MPTDLELARAHLQQALLFLTRAQHSYACSEELLSRAKTAHGAGVRRLARVPVTAAPSHVLAELRALDLDVERNIVRLENEARTTPYFMAPAAL